MDRSATSPTSGPRSTNPFAKLVQLFSSVWTGVTLLLLIFLYSSIGSALYLVRQHPAIELTEMEWFDWWPFQVLIALFCITLVVATIRRIPLRATTAGVWMIHTGILTLCAGSVYYFSTKVEGDTPIFRRRVVIHIPGAKEPLHLLARPGNQVSASVMGGAYQFSIASIQPDWPIRSEPDEGKTAYSVSVMVQTPRERFIRQLLAGFPQYTEDIIPGQGRAVKATGKKLVDESLELTLSYEPQEYFFIKDTAAVYLRAPGAPDWTERPIHGLPHFNDRVGSPDQIMQDVAGRAVPLRAIDLPVPPDRPDDPYAAVDLRVVGYLRYAFEDEEWTADGDALNPVVGLRLRQGSQSLDYRLAAFDPRTQTAQEGQIAFRWVESAAQLDELLADSAAYLDVAVPDSDVKFSVPIAFAEQNPDPAFQEIEGTPFAYRVDKAIDNLRIGEDRVVSVAIVQIRTPEGTFTRWVADDPSSTKDLGDGSSAEHEFRQPDSRIQMAYRPSVSRLALLTVVAGPDPLGVHVLLRQGGVRRFTAKVGDSIPLTEQITLDVTALYPNARRVVKPRVVPVNQRDRNAGTAFAWIQLAVREPGAAERRLWLPYNDYAMPNEQYLYAGRVKYDPRVLHLADGRPLELMFSRERYSLPSAVVLDDFTLLTHQGGLVGTNRNVRDYVSHLRFVDDAGGLSEVVDMRLNNPASRAGFWFFQSTWDPPSGRSAGMNYTGAGVGNRNGVYIQLAGTVIAVLGMLYTFYFKPLIIRRRRQAVYAEVQQPVAVQPQRTDGRAPVTAGDRAASISEH